MAGLKNDKDKPVVAETTNSTETNVNNETTNTDSTETNVNNETTNTEVVTQNQVTAEVKKEKEEIKEDKTYIYIGEEVTKDGFILKYKGFYTSEQLNKIKNGMSNYEEIEGNFIDLDEYSEDK